MPLPPLVPPPLHYRTCAEGLSDDLSEVNAARHGRRKDNGRSRRSVGFDATAADDRLSAPTAASKSGSSKSIASRRGLSNNGKLMVSTNTNATDVSTMRLSMFGSDCGVETEFLSVVPVAHRIGSTASRSSNGPARSGGSCNPGGKRATKAARMGLPLTPEPAVGAAHSRVDAFSVEVTETESSEGDEEFIGEGKRRSWTDDLGLCELADEAAAFMSISLAAASVTARGASATSQGARLAAGVQPVPLGRSGGSISSSYGASTVASPYASGQGNGRRVRAPDSPGSQGVEGLLAARAALLIPPSAPGGRSRSCTAPSRRDAAGSYTAGAALARRAASPGARDRVCPSPLRNELSPRAEAELQHMSSLKRTRGGVSGGTGDTNQAANMWSWEEPLDEHADIAAQREGTAEGVVQAERPGVELSAASGSRIAAQRRMSAGPFIMKRGTVVPFASVPHAHLAEGQLPPRAPSFAWSAAPVERSVNSLPSNADPAGSTRTVPLSPAERRESHRHYGRRLARNLSDVTDTAGSLFFGPDSEAEEAGAGRASVPGQVEVEEDEDTSCIRRAPCVMDSSGLDAAEEVEVEVEVEAGAGRTGSAWARGSVGAVQEQVEVEHSSTLSTATVLPLDGDWRSSGFSDASSVGVTEPRGSHLLHRPAHIDSCIPSCDARSSGQKALPPNDLNSFLEASRSAASASTTMPAPHGGIGLLPALASAPERPSKAPSNASTADIISEQLSPPSVAPDMRARQKRNDSRASSAASSTGGLVDRGVGAHAAGGAARLAAMRQLAVGPARPAWGLVHVSEP